MFTLKFFFPKHYLRCILNFTYASTSTDIDFETFLIMKPDHIKEAIPSLGPRIKFENLYSKFLSGSELIIWDKTNDPILDEMDKEATVDIGQMIFTMPPPNKNEVMSASSSKEKSYLQTAEVFDCVVCK